MPPKSRTLAAPVAQSQPNVVIDPRQSLAAARDALRQSHDALRTAMPQPRKKRRG